MKMKWKTGYIIAFATFILNFLLITWIRVTEHNVSILQTSLSILLLPLTCLVFVIGYSEPDKINGLAFSTIIAMASLIFIML